MALQGTIETFALPEVLRLLGSTAKTGRLRLSGDRGSGSVWIDGGKVVGAEATGLRDGVSPVSVVFELLRFAHGSFSFDDDQTNTRPGTPQDIEVLLGEAERQLADWQEIEAVIPSGSVGLTLADELPVAEVVIDANRWQAIVAVARGATAGAIADALALDELEGCRRAKDLVEEGLVRVVETPVEPMPDAETEPVEAAPDESAAPDPWTRSEPAPETTNGFDHGPVDLGGSAAASLGDGGATESSSVAPPSGVAQPSGSEPRYASEPSPFPEPLPSPEASNGSTASNGQSNGQEAWHGQEAWQSEDLSVGQAAPPPADTTYGDGVGHGGFGQPVGDQPSSARAELDAMASGFGLADSIATPTPDHDQGFGQGFDQGFEQGFASDPSEDPAFSFAAPDGGTDQGGLYGAAGAGGYESHAPMAPGAALFADDVVAAPAAAEPVAMGGGDLFAPGTAVFDPTTPDDAGDAAEVARQLANLSPKAARAVAAAARATTVEEREAALAEVTAEGDEPINRGLLLKFLSSVQS